MAGTLLLADDSITIQKVVELTFAGSELDVVAVSSGRELLQRLDEVNPDIVLCDVVMPEMDGYEICQHLKSEPSTLHIPVVLLTGTFEPFDRDRALAAGCDAIVTKPFEAKELVRIVRELLETGRTEPEAHGLEEGTSGIPEGVPSVDFTTTGFDRMVPPPAEEPVQPEEGLEVTSIGGAAGGGGNESPLEPEPGDAEADLPWGEEVPDIAEAPGVDETFPSPPRAVPQDVEAFAPGSNWSGEEADSEAPARGASPWDTAPPVDPPSPWDTAPPLGDGPEGSGHESGASEQSGHPPEDSASPGPVQESHPEEPSPVWGGRPSGAPPAPQPAAYEEVELDEDDGFGSPEMEEEQETASPGPFEGAPSASPVSPAPVVPSPTIPAEEVSPAPAEGIEERVLDGQPTRAKDECGDQEQSPGAKVQQVVSLDDVPVAAAQFRDLTDEEVERIARRVMELAQPLMERITWEVIPDMAEMLVQKRIRELEEAVDEEN